MWPVRFLSISQDRDSTTFLGKLFLFLGLFLPRSRTLHFPSLNSMRCLVVHSSSLSRPFWMAAQPPNLSNPPPSFVSSADLCKVHDVPASRSLMKMISSIGSSIYPFRAPLVAGQQLDFMLFFTVLMTQQFSQFWINFPVLLASPYSIRMSTRLSRETVKSCVEVK